MCVDKPITIRWKRLSKAWGHADFDAWAIDLNKKQNDIQILGTALHEVAHLCFPNITEAAIEKFEKHSVDVLLRLGFRHRESDRE